MVEIRRFIKGGRILFVWTCLPGDFWLERAAEIEALVLSGVLV